MDIPFGDEVMTIIMGIEDPAAPGQHGPCKMPEMDPEAVNVLTKIRDLCDLPGSMDPARCRRWTQRP